MTGVAEVTEVTVPHATGVTEVSGATGDSLAARVRARREQHLARAKARLLIPVAGYEDLLAGRYRPLGFEETRKIQLRHEDIGRDPADEVAACADLLIAACEAVVDAGNPSRELSAGWTAGVIGDLFGVSMPDGTTTRQALILALGSDGVMEHFGAFTRAAQQAASDAEAAAVGESTPTVVG